MPAHDARTFPCTRHASPAHASATCTHATDARGPHQVKARRAAGVKGPESQQAWQGRCAWGERGDTRVLWLSPASGHRRLCLCVCAPGPGQTQAAVPAAEADHSSGKFQQQDSDARHRPWTPQRHTQASHPTAARQTGTHPPPRRAARHPDRVSRDLLLDGDIQPQPDPSAPQSPGVTLPEPSCLPAGCHPCTCRDVPMLPRPGPRRVPDVPGGPGQGLPRPCPRGPDRSAHSPRHRPAAAMAAGSSAPWGCHAPCQQTPGSSVKPTATRGLRGRPAATWLVWWWGPQTPPQPAPGRGREAFI